MAPSEVPRWQVAALFVVVVATSAGVLGYSATHPPVPPCATDPGATVCPPANGNITYSSEEVTIPANGSGFGPVSDLAFQGIQFRLWPEFLSPSTVYLQGTGTEPGGVDLAFIVFASNASVGGNPPPTNAEVQSWYSADGVFGVTWLGGTSSAVNVQLSVASPQPLYADENVTLPSQVASFNLSAGTENTTTETVGFHGVQFSLQLQNDFFVEGLIASAQLANGTIVPLPLATGGPSPAACGITGDAPYDILGNATCLQAADPARGVGLVWGGGSTATLMVRIG
jgi:hypothetical protein